MQVRRKTEQMRITGSISLCKEQARLEDARQRLPRAEGPRTWAGCLAIVLTHQPFWDFTIWAKKVFDTRASFLPQANGKVSGRGKQREREKQRREGFTFDAHTHSQLFSCEKNFWTSRGIGIKNLTLKSMAYSSRYDCCPSGKKKNANYFFH